MREWIRSRRDRAFAWAIAASLKAIAGALPQCEHLTGTNPSDLQFQAQGAFTGLCPVPRCDYGTKDNICPSHGRIEWMKL